MEGDAVGTSRLTDWLARDHREMRAISASLVLLAFGIAILWAAKEIVGVEESAVFIALLLIPLVSYALISDRLRLTEFRAAGFEAKFAEVAGSAVTPHSEPVPVGDMVVVEKAGPDALRQVLEDYDASEPIVMTVPVGGRTRYGLGPLRQYPDTLAHLRTFKLVIFVDQDGRFVAYAPHWLVRGFLDRGALGNEFVRVLNSGKARRLRSYPGIVSEAITVASTNAEALREMDRHGLEALVVLDEDRRVAGIVERDRVLTKMLLALAP